MPRLIHPAPERRRTPAGLTAHIWRHDAAVAEPVMLIHGFASNTLYNWAMTRWLDPLADTGRTVIAVDLPGHGTSQDAETAGVRTGHILDDLDALVDEVLTDEDPLDRGHTAARVSLHGYSLGARLSWEYAWRRPDRIRRLILGGPSTTDRLRGLHPAQARAWAEHGYAPDPPLPEDPLTRSVVTVASAIPDQNLLRVVELLLSLAADPYEPEVSVPRVPTLVVAGAQDSVATGAERLVELVRRAGAEAQYVQIRGRNHINVLTSGEYKDEVIAFLR